MNLAKMGDVVIDVVTSETVDHSLEATQHPVEKGADVVDHVKESPFTMSVSGAFTGKDSWQRLKALRKIKSDRQPTTYVGRNLMHNMVIIDLSTDHAVHNRYGADFTMTLQNIKYATKQRFKDKKKASQVSERTHRGRQQVKSR